MEFEKSEAKSSSFNIKKRKDYLMGNQPPGGRKNDKKKKKKKFEPRAATRVGKKKRRRGPQTVAKIPTGKNLLYPVRF